MTERKTRKEAVASGSGGSVGTPFTLSSVPTWSVPVTDTGAENFAREDFEAALDKVTRPVKGKYADILPSSEEYIRDKRREVELEDRPS